MKRVLTGMVYCPDFHFHPGTVRMEDGLISGVEIKEGMPADELDYIIPGLVDIHFHGCMGMDFCDGTEEAMSVIAAWEAARGVTSICPATLTLPPEELTRILSAAAEFAEGQRKQTAGSRGCKAEEQGKQAAGSRGCKVEELGKQVAGSRGLKAGGQLCADLIGINMEGPFISSTKKGAQNERYIRPFDVQLCRSFMAASGGLVKLIGIAPEENPGYEDFIGSLKDEVRISLAHTNADYDTAMRAFAAGASHAVHLFNAMPEMAHRKPGVVGAVFDSPHVTAELICDGNHIHPSVVRAAFAMLGDERIVLISDSLAAAGMGDGEILLGGQKVIVKGKRAVLAEGGNLAGSVSSLMDCVRTAVKTMGIPLESAVRCAAYNPAKVIGEEDRCGSIQPGRKADLVVLDRELNVKTVYKDGAA